MVDAVEVRDVVQEEAALPPQERAIDGGGGAALEVPRLPAIVRQLARGVVQIGDHDDWARRQRARQQMAGQECRAGRMLEVGGMSMDKAVWMGLTPVRHRQPRDAVVLHDRCERVDVAGGDDGDDHCPDSGIAEEDGGALFGREQDGFGKMDGVRSEPDDEPRD